MVEFTAYHDVRLDGEFFAAGPHHVAKPTKKLLRLLGSAHHAGVIEVTEGLDDGHVQSQEDGEAAYADALGKANPVTGAWDGPWVEGNLLAYEETQAALAAEREIEA